MRRAFKGDGALLLRNADQLTGRHHDGTYSNETREPPGRELRADGGHPRRPATYGRAAAAAAAPRAGAAIRGVPGVGRPCRAPYWPHPAALGPLKVEGSAPILVVGTERDPVTPYAWARKLAGPRWGRGCC
ncbi:hypothetical protein GCM10020220_024530 [Nonomuraea rubra]|uniref:alpha/beta hydrolase n=1 Tax=Nonomuraea rubra TaxID=46180 RepID=UPI0031ED0146